MGKIISLIVLCFVVHLPVSVYADSQQKTERMLYLTKELVTELEDSSIKEKEMILKKARFIREKVKAEVLGRPTNINKEPRPLMGTEERR